MSHSEGCWFMSRTVRVWSSWGFFSTTLTAQRTHGGVGGGGVGGGGVGGGGDGGGGGGGGGDGGGGDGGGGDGGGGDWKLTYLPISFWRAYLERQMRRRAFFYWQDTLLCASFGTGCLQAKLHHGIS